MIVKELLAQLSRAPQDHEVFVSISGWEIVGVEVVGPENLLAGNPHTEIKLKRAESQSRVVSLKGGN